MYPKYITAEDRYLPSRPRTAGQQAGERQVHPGRILGYLQIN